jgi:hypothetical protein
MNLILAMIGVPLIMDGNQGEPMKKSDLVNILVDFDDDQDIMAYNDHGQLKKISGFWVADIKGTGKQAIIPSFF